MKLIDEATRAALEEMGAIVTSTPGRFEAVHMAGEAGAMTFIVETEASPKLQAAIVKRITEVARLASSLGKISNDVNLSTEGKQNLRRTLDGDRRKIAARLESDATEVGNMLWLAQESERQLYEAPVIAPGDFVTAMDDREIRAWIAGQTPEQLVAVVAQMSARQLEALKRSPVPLADSMNQIVNAKWEEQLKADRARELEEVRADLDNARFGVASIKQLREAVQRLAFNDAENVIKPYVATGAA